MAERLNIKDFEKLYRETEIAVEAQNDLLRRQLSNLDGIFNKKRRIAIEEEIAANKARLANEIQEKYNDALEEGYEFTKNTTAAVDRRIKKNQTLIKQEKDILANQQKINKALAVGNTLLRTTYRYLMDNDKIIRQTILDLGMSGAKAAEMRESFYDSAAGVARLGGNLQDVKSIMTGFADETGRARALSSQLVYDIESIGRGTGLGVENAAKMAGQFELMGINASQTMKYIEGIVETSELMGVNTTAVLKNISNNFKELQKFSFKKGTQGFAEMAQYASKFKVDMTSVLGAAADLRGLEQAVDVAANLQVLGGEFAKTDPFKLLYQARNAPEELQKSINNMVKGVATFRETASGALETYISPADMDRLRQAETVLGLQSGELTVQARRMAEIQKMRQRTLGMGLTGEEKTLLEGMYTYDSEKDKFFVQIAGQTKAVRDLAATDLELLKTESVRLEKRAKDARTFEETFKATIEELKTALLPLLNTINTVLAKWTPKIEGLLDKFSEKKTWAQIGIVAATFMGAATIMRGAGALVNRATGGLARLFTKPTLMGGAAGGGLSGSRALGAGKGAAARSVGAGKAAGLAGAGAGIAAAGMGGGILMAAKGLSALADSMSKLTPEQADSLKSIATTMAITFPAAAIGMTLAGKAAEASALGMGILAGVLLAIGGSIALATGGISKMVNSFANLATASKDAGPEMKEITAGIIGVSGALATATLGLPGALGLARVFKVMGKNAGDLNEVGDAFRTIQTVLSGSKDDYSDVEQTLRSISKMDFGNLNALNKIGKAFDKPLQVEFADKNVSMVADISLNINGERFHNAIKTTEWVVSHIDSAKKNKNALNI